MNDKPKEEKSLREKQVEERRKRMRELNPLPERVRVSPASDELRKVLKHPNGVKFGDSGSAEWPLDQFTRRRIKDGSVTEEGGDRNRDRDRTRRGQSQQPQPGQQPQQPPQPPPQPSQQPTPQPQPAQTPPRQ